MKAHEWLEANPYHKNPSYDIARTQDIIEFVDSIQRLLLDNNVEELRLYQENRHYSTSRLIDMVEPFTDFHEHKAYVYKFSTNGMDVTMALNGGSRLYNCGTTWHINIKSEYDIVIEEDKDLFDSTEISLERYPDHFHDYLLKHFRGSYKDNKKHFSTHIPKTVDAYTFFYLIKIANRKRLREAQ